jgi:hypothetical protein
LYAFFVVFSIRHSVALDLSGRSTDRGSAATPVPAVVRFGAEQPSADVIGDCTKARIVDPLAVVRGHRRIDMSHDVIDGWLILAFIRHGSEDMPQRVETESLASVNSEGLQ